MSATASAAAAEIQDEAVAADADAAVDFTLQEERKLNPTGSVPIAAAATTAAKRGMINEQRSECCC